MFRRGALVFVLAAAAAPPGVNPSVPSSIASTPARTGRAQDRSRLPVRPAAATSCTYSVSPASGAYPAGPNRAAFIVITQPGCAWTATAGAPWITLESAGGTGSGAVLFTTSDNRAGAARSASISISGQASQ